MAASTVQEHLNLILLSYLESKGIKNQNIAEWRQGAPDGHDFNPEKFKEKKLNQKDFAEYCAHVRSKGISTVCGFQDKDGSRFCDTSPEGPHISEGIKEHIESLLVKENATHTILPCPGYKLNKTDTYALHSGGTHIAQYYLTQTLTQAQEMPGDEFVELEFHNDSEMDIQTHTIAVLSALMQESRKAASEGVISSSDNGTFARVLCLLSGTKRIGMEKHKNSKLHQDLAPACHDTFEVDAQVGKANKHGKVSVFKTQPVTQKLEYDLSYDLTKLMKAINRTKHLAKEYMVLKGKYPIKTVTVSAPIKRQNLRARSKTQEKRNSFLIPVGVPVSLADGKVLNTDDSVALATEAGDRAHALLFVKEINTTASQLRAFQIEATHHMRQLAHYPMIANKLLGNLLIKYYALTGDTNRTRLDYWANLINLYLDEKSRNEIKYCVQQFSSNIPDGHSLSFVYKALNILCKCEANMHWGEWKIVLNEEQKEEFLVPHWKAIGATLSVQLVDMITKLANKLSKHYHQEGNQALLYGEPCYSALSPYLHEWQSMLYHNAPPLSLCDYLAGHGKTRLLSEYLTLMGKIYKDDVKKSREILFNVPIQKQTLNKSSLGGRAEFGMIMRQFTKLSMYPRSMDSLIHPGPRNVGMYYALTKGVAECALQEGIKRNLIDTTTYAQFLLELVARLAVTDKGDLNIPLAASSATSELILCSVFQSDFMTTKCIDTILFLILGTQHGILEKGFWEGLNHYLSNSTAHALKQQVGKQLQHTPNLITKVAEKLWASLERPTPLTAQQLSEVLNKQCKAIRLAVPSITQTPFYG